MAGEEQTLNKFALKRWLQIARQQDEIEKQQRNENTLLPATLDYRQVTGLSNEVIAKLNDH
ncbi:hypothetical protein, partial [Klebsiella pneumoniae]|uniref:hypothetical protein n=1 Tax=Klebsiella pneumoniae TaxID=573 RepID=UPI003EE1C75D